MKCAAVLAATVILSATAVSGCGGSRTQASASPSTTPMERVTVPAGWQSVTATKAGIIFSVPADWVVLNSSVMQGAKFNQVAKLMNATPETVAEITRQVDVFAVSPHASGRYTTNVDAGLTPLASLPTPQYLRELFPQMNGTMQSSDDVATPIGTARVAVYTLNGVKAHGEIIYLNLKTGIASMAFTARSAATVKALAAEVLPTLRAAS